MVASGYHLAPPAAWLEVTGEDAFSFLQSQFTQDLRGPEDRAAYGLWLDHRGRLQGDSFALRLGAGSWGLLSYTTAAASLQERLEKNLVADDVAVRDRTGEVTLLTLIADRLGTVAEALLLPLPEPGRRVIHNGAVLLHGRRGVSALELVIPPSHIPTLVKQVEAIGLKPLSSELLTHLRVQAGLPSVPAEVGPGETPHEAGLAPEAVSFTKGCFTGQEVVARMEHKARALKGLRKIVLEHPLPDAVLPVSILADNQPAGELRALSPLDGRTGLALLKLKALGATSSLSIMVRNQEMSLKIVE